MSSVESQRSGAHASLGDGSAALSDANECVKLAPQWAKGYGRKGAALILCGARVRRTPARPA